MAQSEHLIETLKRELRRQRVNYAQVAQALSLSEASVKRMFSHNNFTLQRLEDVCALVGWDIIDLSKATQRNYEQLDNLTPEQEKEIAADLELLMVAVSVINGFSFTDLQSYYRLNEHECIQRLATLDRLQLIDLLPGNRIKLKISQNFRWDPQGPIQAFFLDSVVQQFFSTRFAKKSEKLLVINGLLSEGNNEAVQRRMDKLVAEFGELMKEESAMPVDKKQGNTLVVALRQWRFPLFENLVRKAENE